MNTYSEEMVEKLLGKLINLKQKKYEYLDLAEKETDQYKKQSLYNFCRDLESLIKDIQYELIDIIKN